MICFKEKAQLREQEGNIRKWYSQLRNDKPEIYEPKMVSIGPFHHGKSHLLSMEEIKSDNLSSITTEQILYELKCILTDKAIGCLHQAREQYGENIDMSDEKFTDMLLMDGAFIVGVCLRFSPIRVTCRSSTISIDYAMLWRDLMLMENQIPFFIVNEFYKRIARVWYNMFGTTEVEGYPDFISLILNILEINLPLGRHLAEDKILNIFHLKHLALDPHLIPDEPRWQFNKLMRMIYAFTGGKSEHPKTIPSTTELHEAGITFKMIKIPKTNNNQFHLKVFFRVGTLEISQLHVDRFTRDNMINLISFEQFRRCHNIPQHFTDYCILMSNLIKTSKDVHILWENGIVQHDFADDSEVAKVFDSICKDVDFDLEQQSYIELYRDVVLFCRAPRRWCRAGSPA